MSHRADLSHGIWGYGIRSPPCANLSTLFPLFFFFPFHILPFPHCSCRLIEFHLLYIIASPFGSSSPVSCRLGLAPPPPFVYSIFHSYFIKEKTDRGESPLITQSLFWRLNFHCRVSAGSNAQASSAPPPPLLDPLSAV